MLPFCLATVCPHRLFFDTYTQLLPKHRLRLAADDAHEAARLGWIRAKKERAEADAALEVALKERAEAEEAARIAEKERLEAEEAERIAEKERREAEEAIAAVSQGWV